MAKKKTAEKPMPKDNNGLYHPTLDENFFLPKDHEILLEVIHDLGSEKPQNVMMVGPQGCGKTETAIWYAAKYGRPILQMNCAVVREPKDWFGSKEASDGKTYWKKSIFVQAIEAGAIILFDEFNRLHSTLHNALYPLLDDRRFTYLDELDEILEVKPGTIFFATANIGFSHSGTFQMDAAIEDRFPYRINCDFLPAQIEREILVKKTKIEEELATRLVKLAHTIRKLNRNESALAKPMSLRQLLNTAIMMAQFKKKGLPLSKALNYTLVANYSAEGGVNSERAIVLKAIQGLFNDFTDKIEYGVEKKAKKEIKSAANPILDGINPDDLDFLDD